MAQACDAIPALAAILTEHGTLSEDDLEPRLQQAGVPEPDAVLVELLDELSCPARELLDGRWAWLPALLAGRVFTHRLSADEVTHDLLAVTPDLDPITELCYHDEYQQLADGSPVELVLPGFDEVVLAERGIDPELVAESGALLLAEGTLAALGVAAGDLVGLRLSEQGLAVEPVTAVAESTVGARLATLLGPDEPVYSNVAVYAVCADDPAVFTTALAPLNQIADDYGLARKDEWLAVGGFDFFHWDFERACTRLARRYDLDSDDAFALHTLVQVHGQLESLVDAADVDDGPDVEESSRAGAGRGASTKNATCTTSSCRWPSGWAGSTPKPTSMCCRVIGRSFYSWPATNAAAIPKTTPKARWPRRCVIR